MRPEGFSEDQRGVRLECRHGLIIHSPKTPHTPRACYRTFVYQGEVNDHRCSFLLSSDIKTNPVPSFPCPTCSRPYNKRGGLNPMQCSQCSSWTHYNIRCSGLLQRHHIPPGWVCYRCYPLHNMAPQAAPHSPGSTSSLLPLLPAHHNRPAASHTLPLGPLLASLLQYLLPHQPHFTHFDLPPPPPPNPLSPPHPFQLPLIPHNSDTPLSNKAPHPLPQSHHPWLLPILLLNPPHHLANQHTPSQN